MANRFTSPQSNGKSSKRLRSNAAILCAKATCFKPCGAPVMTGKRTIYAYIWQASGANSKRMQRILSSLSPNLASAIEWCERLAAQSQPTLAFEDDVEDDGTGQHEPK